MEGPFPPPQVPTEEPKTEPPAAEQPLTSQVIPPTAHRPIPRTIWMIPVFLIMSVLAGTWLGISLKKSRDSRQAAMTENTTVAENTPVFKGEVTYLSGSAKVYRNGSPTDLKEGDVLSAAESVETGNSSRVVIGLDDGSIIRMDELTRLDLSELTPAMISVKNQQGKVYARVMKDPQHIFTVTAGNVTVLATGTMFAVEKSDQIKVSVFESTVKVDEADKETVEVGEQQEWNSSEAKIKKLNLEEVKKDNFLAWNMDEDKVEENIPTQTPAPTPKPQPTAKTARIILKGSAGGGGVNLEWTLEGADAPNGVKILKSASENPTYPGSDFVYLGDTGVKSYKWSVKDGKLWHFRVCRYIGDTCTLYSNDVGVQTETGGGEENGNGQVNSISLTVQKQDTKAVLSWSVDGNSPQGFKIAWSKNENPTYPPRDGDLWYYNSSPGARGHTVEGLSGTYHFRVCEYLGGSCGVYSNDVSLNF